MGVLCKARERLRAAEVVPSPEHLALAGGLRGRERGAGRGRRDLAGAREACDWAGLDVVDVGCGDGFHLPRFAADGRKVDWCGAI